jgi:mannose-1-phosphate guanylyltransferase / mannose-6-phosphate isomerase
MKPPLIIPVILSGGAGSRLWPLSRAARPKQFLKFGSEHTLFQNTVLRCNGSIFDPRPIVVSGESQRFLVAEDLREIGASADIVLEPMRRDSCAAIAAGCLVALKRSPDALVLVLAADHIISEQHEFDAAVAAASIDAAAGFLTTFGVTPTHPATGFGYIKPGNQLRDGGAYKIDKFVEKPSLEIAQQYVRDGYFWNSGNFLFRAANFIDELRKLAPLILSAMELALDKAKTDMDFIRLNETEFSRSPQISVDYAVMEKTNHAAIFPVQYHWNDIGSWDAVYEGLAKDEFGNAIDGDGYVLGGSNNLIDTQARFTAVVGVDDLIVVTVDDAVLVTKRGKSEMLKTLITHLKAQKSKLSE